MIVATILDDHDAGFALGAAGYLAKPFTGEELLVAVLALLAPDAAAAPD